MSYDLIRYDMNRVSLAWEVQRKTVGDWRE